MKITPSASNKANFSNVNKIATPHNLQNSVIKEEPSVHISEEAEPTEKFKKPVKTVKESPQKVSIKGLRNLGNTCFFNAVMQNLNQTSLLYYELKNACTPSYSWEVPELVFTETEVIKSESTENLKLKLPHQLPLTNSLFNLFELMNSKVKVDNVSPSALFSEISKKCPQFRHFQEQDSHELLRQLLDNVRQEEIKRQKKAILKYFELENVSPENVDDNMKRRCKAYACYATHSIIEKVFGGILISTVLCEECKISSQIFEPFMDLSLPLFEEKQQENIELNGMLDGGKQDDKALRNRKTDIEEESHGEYVLPKPKYEPGKPSKHQEKKQKQLSKKERKKSRNTKNRQASLSEINDSSVNPQPPESPTADEEQKNHHSAEEENIRNDHNEENQKESDFAKVNGESSVEEQSFAGDKNTDNDEKSNVVAHQNLENTYQVEHAENEQYVGFGDGDARNINQEGIEADCGDNSVSCQVEMVIDDAGNQSSHGATDQVKIHELKQINVVEEVSMSLKTGEIEKEVDPDEDNLTQSFKSVVEHMNNLSTEIGLMAAKSNQSHLEDRMAHLEDEMAHLEARKDHLEDLEFRKAHLEHRKANLEDRMANLEDRKAHFEDRMANLDDRMQALSMQVIDVRIRRDSDRQEMLLNSSESADENESQRTNCTSPKSSIEDSCSNENGDNWCHSVPEQQTKEWISKSLTTLTPRYNASPMECSIKSCLSHFTKPELLTGNNKFKCENCTEMKIRRTGNKKNVVYSNASKQILIFSPPAVLTLHLKRFQQVGMSLRKVNRFVEFPLILDLAPFCSSACVILPHMSSVEDEILYSLYGIVEHSGRLTSGHYTAYVKANKRTTNTFFECQAPLAQCNLEQLLYKYCGADRSSYGDCSNISTEEKQQWFYISDSHVKEVSEAQVLKCQAYLLFYERIK